MPACLRLITAALWIICMAGGSVWAQGAVQGCLPEHYLDRTLPGADRDINWTLSIVSDPERCLQVRVGQSVRWNGSLGTHPLDPEGGDVPNPIAQHADGVVQFFTPGTYGYVCGIHAVMKGAVRVLPAATPVPAAAPFMIILGWLLLCVASARLRSTRH